MIRWDNDKHLWKFGLPRCSHNDVIVAVVTSGAGRRSAREQCGKCGKVGVPLRLSDYPQAPPANAEALAAWERAFAEATQAALANAQRMFAIRQAEVEQENAEWWTAYQVYLQSDDWKERREMVLKRDSYLCQAFLPGCTRRATEVHHTSYELHRAIGSEAGWNLQSVCHGCHEQITIAERAARKK